MGIGAACRTAHHVPELISEVKAFHVFRTRTGISKHFSKVLEDQERALTGSSSVMDGEPERSERKPEELRRCNVSVRWLDEDMEVAVEHLMATLM